MKTFKYKLYRSKKNKNLHQRIDIAGVIYNHLIALHKRHYRRYGKYISLYTMTKHITKLKRLPKYEFWKTLGSQAVENIAGRIDFGYKKFFKKENTRTPNFKKVKKYKSFTLRQNVGYRFINDNTIRIGNVDYRFFNSRKIEGDIKTVTIKRDPLGDIYLFIVTDFEENKPELPLSGKSVGFDFGLKTFLVGSDSKEIESPLFFKQSIQAIKRANRNVSIKKKGSNNRKKALKNLQRVHKKVANQRRDYHFKLAKQLTNEYGVMCFEDLNIEGMKKLWGRKVSDLGFYAFLIILEYQATKTGTIIQKIDRWFPSTKTCHSCGYINNDLSLRDRVWTCVCGETHNRDLNAAINIHREGISSLALGDVSLTKLAIAV